MLTESIVVVREIFYTFFGRYFVNLRFMFPPYLSRSWFESSLFILLIICLKHQNKDPCLKKLFLLKIVFARKIQKMSRLIILKTCRSYKEVYKKVIFFYFLT